MSTTRKRAGRSWTRGRTAAKRGTDTRRRLIDAAIRIILEDGLAAVTTTAVAEAVGIRQPSFYTHFRDIDDCLNIAADELHAAFEKANTEARLAVGTASDPRAALEHSYRAVVEAALAERDWYRVYLRHHRDTTTPFGRKMAELARRGRVQQVKDFEAVAQALGLPEQERERFEAFVDLTITIVRGAVESLVEGRITNKDMIIEEMARITWAALADLVAGGK